jgi:hypothetical protein
MRRRRPSPPGSKQEQDQGRKAREQSPQRVAHLPPRSDEDTHGAVSADCVMNRPACHPVWNLEIQPRARSGSRHGAKATEKLRPNGRDESRRVGATKKGICRARPAEGIAHIRRAIPEKIAEIKQTLSPGVVPHVDHILIENAWGCPSYSDHGTINSGDRIIRNLRPQNGRKKDRGGKNNRSTKTHVFEWQAHRRISSLFPASTIGKSQ